MGTTLWRHEFRRAGWAAMLAPPVAGLFLVTMAVVQARLGAGDRGVARLLMSTLEMGLPLAAGIGAASLVGRDPVVELQLSLPTAYRATLLRRFAVTVGWSALIASTVAAILIGTGWWQRWPSTHGLLVGQLTWISPTAWLAGLGLLAAALLRSPAAAGGVVAICWTFQQVMSDVIQSNELSHLTYLFATTRGGRPVDWTDNRLALLAMSLLFVAGAWLVLGRREPLLKRGTE